MNKLLLVLRREPQDLRQRAHALGLLQAAGAERLEVRVYLLDHACRLAVKPEEGRAWLKPCEHAGVKFLVCGADLRLAGFSEAHLSPGFVLSGQAELLSCMMACDYLVEL